jgi:hypothetical protein
MFPQMSLRPVDTFPFFDHLLQQEAMVLVYRLHCFVVVVNPITSMLLILGEEGIHDEAGSLSFLGQLLMLVDHEIEKINSFNCVVVVGQIAI